MKFTDLILQKTSPGHKSMTGKEILQSRQISIIENQGEKKEKKKKKRRKKKPCLRQWLTGRKTQEKKTFRQWTFLQGSKNQKKPQRLYTLEVVATKHTRHFP